MIGVKKNKFPTWGWGADGMYVSVKTNIKQNCFVIVIVMLHYILHKYIGIHYN